jgi:hypothetical protein
VLAGHLCDAEILENRDMYISLVCTKCMSIGICCFHDTDTYFVALRIPYSTLILNERIATAYNKTLLLELEHVEVS